VKKMLKRMMKLNHQGQVEAVHLPFGRQNLEALSPLPWVWVMEGSQEGRGCRVLMVGVLYQKRALPIGWLVYKGQKGHASAEGHIQAEVKRFKPRIWRGFAPSVAQRS